MSWRAHVLAFEEPEPLREHLLEGHLEDSYVVLDQTTVENADHRVLDGLHIEAHRGAPA